MSKLIEGLRGKTIIVKQKKKNQIIYYFVRLFPNEST